MRIRYRAVLLLAALLLVVAAGQVHAAETPLQAAMDFRDAVINGDEAAFLACFDAGPYQQQMIGAMFSLMQSHSALNDALLDAFGEQGVAEFYGEGGKDPYREIASVTEEDLTVEISGDEATVTKDGDSDDPLQLVNKGGEWLIVFPQAEPTSPEEVEQAEQGVRAMEAMAQAINDVAAMVHDEGMTPASLQEQVAVRVQAAMTSAVVEEEVVEEEYEEEEVVEEEYEEEEVVEEYEEEEVVEEYEEEEVVEEYEEEYDD